jgi:hypothetical protein
MHAFVVALALICGADEELKHPVPAWLPRGAQLGFLINAPMVAPAIRLQWDVTLLEQPHNDFVVIGQLGSAFGLSLETGMSEHYQHVALVGLGYRSTYEKFHWGFQFGLGPVWYRTAYKKGSIYPFENRVLGYAEGRLQAGLRLAPHFILGIYFGYASPWTFSPVIYPGNTYVGGFNLGVFADWR